MNAAIRKAAILISTLDTKASDALLDQMPAEQAAQVRSAIMDLAEIPADEQEQVIAEFLRNGGSNIDDGVELDPQLASRLEHGPVPNHEPRTPARPPFSYLTHFESTVVAAVLRSEQPQTIAVVVSHLPTEKAAAVLEALPAAVSTDALERMAWLCELHPDVVADLDQQLERALHVHQAIAQREPRGLNAVSAVLGALSGRRRQEALKGLAARDERLTRRLGYPVATGTANDGPTHLQPHEPVPQTHPAAAIRYREADEPVIDIEFGNLTALDDADLRQVFAAVEPAVAMLALTGADEPLRRRILRQLPARQADLLRHQLNHPGPLRLYDIEAAQQQLARVAGRLAARGVIQLPRALRFAAAA